MPLRVKLGRLIVRLAIFLIWFLPWYYIVVPIIYRLIHTVGLNHHMTQQGIYFWVIGTAIAISILPIAVVRLYGTLYALRFYPNLGIKNLTLKEEIIETLNIAFIFVGVVIAYYLGFVKLH